MKLKLWKVLAAAALWIGAAQPALAGGCGQIHGPTTITVPGCYDITRSIVGAGPPVITIDVGSTGSVVIKFCGHKLTQLSTTAPVIFVNTAATVILEGPGETEGGGSAIQSPSSPTQFRVTKFHFHSTGGNVIDLQNAKGFHGEDLRLASSGGGGGNLQNVDRFWCRRCDVEGALFGHKVVGARHAELAESHLRNLLGNGVEFDASGVPGATASARDVTTEDTGTSIRMNELAHPEIRYYRAAGSRDTAVHLTGCKNGRVGNVHVSDGDSDGIQLVGSSGMSIENIGIDNVVGRGLHLDGNSNNNWIANVQAWAAALEGVLNQGKRNRFRELSVVDPTLCPVTDDVTAADSLYDETYSYRASSCACAGTLSGSHCLLGSTAEVVNDHAH